MDFEAWERDHTVLTEFGWSLAGWKDGTFIENCGHFIVEEARTYTNSQYVPDYRYVSLLDFLEFDVLNVLRQNYTFGTSETIKKAAFKKRIQDLIRSLSEYGPIFLVFHDNSQDVK